MKLTLKAIPLLLILLFVFAESNAQHYSIDQKPKKRIHVNIHLKGLFKKDQAKKAMRKDEKKKRKAARYEIKARKKYWKKVDHPDEMNTNKSVYRRMKKNLRKAERVNHDKPRDGFFKRMSHKKIKLPKLTIRKINWPWKTSKET